MAVLSCEDMLVEPLLRRKLGADDALVGRLACRASCGVDDGMDKDKSMCGMFPLA